MRIWLTGGSGSGKSVVAALFQKRGFLLVDADAISRKIAEKGTAAYREIIAAFGEGFLLPSGELDRRALGNAVFGDEEKLAVLNGIMHKFIIAEMCDRADGEKNVIMDAPLPNTFGVAVDKTLVVAAPQGLRAARIMQRDGITEEEAQRRLSAQAEDAEYIKNADAVLINDGDRTALEKAAETYIKEWYTA